MKLLYETEEKVLGTREDQHRGNTGEGQFHLNQSNRAYHYNNFLIKELNYNELYNILGENK